MDIELGVAHAGVGLGGIKDPGILAGVKGLACALIFVFIVMSSQAVAASLMQSLLKFCGVDLAAGWDCAALVSGVFDIPPDASLRRK